MALILKCDQIYNTLFKKIVCSTLILHELLEQMNLQIQVIKGRIIREACSIFHIVPHTEKTARKHIVILNMIVPLTYFRKLFTCAPGVCIRSKNTSQSGKRSIRKNILYNLRKGTLHGYAADGHQISSNKNPKHHLSECFSYAPFYWDAIGCDAGKERAIKRPRLEHELAKRANLTSHWAQEQTANM